MKPQHRPFSLEMPVLDRQAVKTVQILLHDLLFRFESCYRDPLMLCDEPDPSPPRRPRAQAKRRTRLKTKASS